MTTVPSIFWTALAERADRTALLIKEQGRYRPRIWAEFADDVKRLATALRQLEVTAGDRVVQVSENRYEWLVADLAIHSIGAVHVPVHASLSGQQVAYQIEHSGARVALFSTTEQSAKLNGLGSTLPDFTAIAYEPAITDVAGRRVLRLHDLMQAAVTDEFQPAAPRPEDPATILYTSGTTGEPKGVVLSQRNLVSNALGVLEVAPAQTDDVRLNFLPLSHIFARTCDVYTWITGGSILALAESRATVLEDCAAVHPTLLNGVPYFFERIAKLIGEVPQDQQAARLRALLGGRVRFCCSGGAALPDHVYDFFAARGLPVRQGYGLTESSPVITVSTPEVNRRGTVGKVIPGVEVRIADDGEILTRGPHVMLGYYRDPVATQCVLKDGWLYTGDIGRQDEDGFLYITGRKKELIVTSGGKNIAPVLLETLLIEDPLVYQAMILGDGRKCLAALIVPDADALRGEILRRGIAVVSKEQALKHPAVMALYADVLAKRLECLSHYEQVAYFTLLPRAFSIEEGELTPKLSLRRAIIQQHFAAEIEAMYLDESAAAAKPC